jgi:hypothetical protein
MLGKVKRAVLGNCWLHGHFSLVVQFGDSNRFTISNCRRIILRPQSSACLLDLSRTKRGDRPGRGGPCVSSECHHFRAVDAGCAQDGEPILVTTAAGQPPRAPANAALMNVRLVVLIVPFIVVCRPNGTVRCSRALRRFHLPPTSDDRHGARRRRRTWV